MDDQTNDQNQKPTIEEPTEEDLELFGFDDFFDELEPNMSLVISRLEPSEFKGVLEEIDIPDATNPISLNYLINKWGGHKLLLKLRRKRGVGQKSGTFAAHRVVNLYSYPPLRWGKPLKRQVDFQANFDDEPRQDKKPESTMETMLGVAQMMQQMRSSELQTLATLLGSLHQPSSQTAVPPSDPFNQASKMLSLFGQMQQMTSPPPQSAGDGDEVIGLLGKLAETFTATQKQASTPAPALVAKNPGPVTPQGVISNLRSDFLKLPDAQKGEALQLLFGQLQSVGGDDAILQAVQNLGIIDLDEEDTENESYPDTGREHGPDEGDNPPDR